MRRNSRFSFVILAAGLLLAARHTADAAPHFSLTAFDSLHVFREGEAPAGGTATIRIALARGESESFQVALSNQSGASLSDIRIALSGLPGVKAKVYAAGSVMLEKPGRTTSAVPGRYFDLLRPAGWENVAPGGYRPYWVDLQAAADARPGVYQGKLTATAAGESVNIPVSLQVWNFCLPVRPSMKMAFAFGRSWMERYYGRTLTAAELQAAQDAMLDEKLGPLPMWDNGAELFQPERLKQCRARGMNVFLLPVSGNTDAEIKQSIAALAPRVQMLRAAGALKDTYLFGYDEITMARPEQIPAMRQAYEQFHALYPDIKRINTSKPDSRLNDFVDIYVIPTSMFTPQMAQGRETWWYSVGADNLTQEPDFRIDFPPAAPRIYLVADWKVGVKGHLYWAVQREWPANKGIQDKTRPENEWRTGYNNAFDNSWVQDNGGGNLFYPDGAGSMLPTPRVKRLRDGIEDYEYLAQLQGAASMLAQAKPAGWQALQRQAQALLAVPDTLVKASGGWSETWNATGNTYACSITTHPNAIHGGKQALRVLPETTENSVYQDVPATPGKTYAVSGWIKTDDLSGSARLRAEYLDAAGKTLQTAESKPVSGSSAGFIAVSATLPAAPAGTQTLRARLVSIAANTSRDPLQKAFFDDCRVTENGQARELKNADFEARRLWINYEPQPLLEYRARVAACLDQCAKLLRQSGPFTGAE